MAPTALGRSGSSTRYSRVGAARARVGSTRWLSCLHTFKTEFSYREACDTYERAQTTVCASSEVCDTRQRCPSAHGDRAPLAYEQALTPHARCCPAKC